MGIVNYLVLLLIFGTFFIYALFTGIVLPLEINIIITVAFTIIVTTIIVRFVYIYQQFKSLNMTISEIMNGNFDTRVISNNHVLDRELNANINRLAKRLAKLSIKKEEDEQTIQILTNNLTSPIIFIDRDGKIRYVNNRFFDHFQSTLEVNDIYEKLRIRSIYNFIDDAFIFETKQTANLQVGDKYYVANAIPIRNNHNNLERFAGILFIFYDITEIKKYEKLQREFLADASHELKTPISAIKGASEILLNGESHSSDTVREFLGIINSENDRMEKIVSDILLISRLENESLLIKMERINLNSLLNDCYEVIKYKLENKKQTINMNIIDNLSITGNYEKLKGAFLNLFVNAIDYTNEEKTITVTAKESPIDIVLSIKDEGIGISDTDLPHIFDRFYRIDKARSRETGGTGLGLAIVKSTMDIHKAKIEVKSKQNDGTEFIIHFPKDGRFDKYK